METLIHLNLIQNIQEYPKDELAKQNNFSVSNIYSFTRLSYYTLGWG